MKRSIRNRYLLLLFSLVAALYALAPSLWAPNQAPAIFLSDGLNLGLDLQGGAHLTLEVETAKAVQNRLYAESETISKALAEAQLKLPTQTEIDRDSRRPSLLLSFASSADRDAARGLVSSLESPIYTTSVLDDATVLARRVARAL